MTDGDDFVFCRPDGSRIPPVDDSLEQCIARAQRDLTIVRRAPSFTEEPRAVYRISTCMRTADPPVFIVR